MKGNIWIFHSFRPKMKIWDSLRNKRVRALVDAYENGTIDNDLSVRKMENKHVAWASLHHTPAEVEGMIVAEADEDGDFYTENPVTAYLINKELEAQPFMNHPLTKKPVKFEVNKSSPKVPTDAQFREALKKVEAEEKKTS